jgi:acylphosphatase
MTKRAAKCRVGREAHISSSNSVWEFVKIHFLNVMAIRLLYVLMERITAVARGQVQGVGYRYFVSECAHATGVHGYVKNLPDGTVEIVGESSPAALEDFLRLAHARDDPFIRVEDITVKKGPATGEYHGFRVGW